MKRIVIYAILLIPALLHAQPTWEVENASVGFEIKNAGFPVRGSFDGLEADVRFDPDQPARSAFAASVDASTVRSGIRLRDRHLQKHDYFDAANHPRIHMDCVRIEEAEAGGFQGLFRLRIKEVTQEVTVPFTFVRNGSGGTLAGHFTINRLDFGLGEPSLILSDTVKVSLEVDLIPAE